MSVWYAIPSKRPAAEAEQVLAKWREQGYRIALWRDYDVRTELHPDIRCDIWRTGTVYPGYAKAVNSLTREILASDPAASWIVTGGDDVEPDLHVTANVIAVQCSQYFGGTFGVMQPTGDRWGHDQPGPWPKGSAYIDRICGSPWMGRDFCQRINGGCGPLREEFRHMFVDEALQEIAIKHDCLWQRRDLIHYHNHWARKPGTPASACPEFLREVNSPEHWKESRAIFDGLKAAGWPGSEPSEWAVKYV